MRNRRRLLKRSNALCRRQEREQRKQERIITLRALPAVLAVEVPTQDCWTAADLKWNDQKWWVVQRDEVSEYKRQGIRVGGREVSVRSLAQRLRRRCPEYAEFLADRYAERKANAERRKRQDAEQREADERERREYEEDRAKYLSTSELLASGDGWTRHYIRKRLGKPDKIEEYTTGCYSYRKDVVRFLWLKERVAETLRLRQTKTLPMSAA